MTWQPGDPCPGCGQRPCVCVTISLPMENTPGWWDDNDWWHDGWAVTHTMGHYPENGPPFCKECTDAFGDWVKWPCEGSKR